MRAAGPWQVLSPPAGQVGAGQGLGGAGQAGKLPPSPGHSSGLSSMGRSCQGGREHPPTQKPSFSLPPSPTPQLTLRTQYIKAAWDGSRGLCLPPQPPGQSGGLLQAPGGCEGRAVRGRASPGPSCPRNSEGGGSSVWTTPPGCRPGASLGVPSRWTTVTSAQGAEDPRPSPRNSPGGAVEGWWSRGGDPGLHIT